MACWKIDFEDPAKKEFKKLDKYSQHLIEEYLDTKVLKSKHPKYLGKPLSFNYKGLWRYRVGKFRIICKIKEDRLVVMIVKIGKRDGVY